MYLYAAITIIFFTIIFPPWLCLTQYCRMLTEELRVVGVASRLSNVGSFTYRLAL